MKNRKGRLALILLAGLVGLTFAACQSGDRSAGNAVSATGAAKTAGAPSAHAPEHAKPGSYEDWCDEHQVPESLCTQCNPALVAAFKATGDWCDEHGLPESQCRICNPDLKIVRPPKVESEG